MSEKGFFNRIKFFPKAFLKEEKYNPNIKPVAEASFPSGVFFQRELYTHSLTGEKNLGELGPPRNYLPDYFRLRQYSWQAYTESEIAKTIIDRHVIWSIGRGLKLQSEPAADLLKAEGIDINAQDFSKLIESMFRVYRKSKISDYSSMRNLDVIARRCKKNAILGGDCLVILRFDGKDVSTQLIDGAHVKSPGFGTEAMPQINPDTGNRIIHGVELDSTGKHIQYWVHNLSGQIDPIPARSESSGLQIAFLVYGSEYRLDSVRGMPLLAVILETLKKLERYKEAVVGSAEERQKIVYQIVHQIFSDGSHPNLEGLTAMFDVDKRKGDNPEDQLGKKLANQVQATTNKSTYNMPRGAELKGLDSKNELYFAEFFDKNIDIVCAVISMPPNVAMQKYNDSYSASRASLKDWEHTLHVDRDDFAFQFYQPVYNYKLHVWILQNKVSAPGYLTALRNNDEMIMEAYRMARWVGPMIPHIDPLKEVEAIRLKLGTAGAHIPLTTVEAATEDLSGGDAIQNMEQFAREINQLDTLGIKPVVKTNTPALPTNP